VKNLYLGQICSHMSMHTYACEPLTTPDNLPLIPFEIFLVEISSYMMLFTQSDSQRKIKRKLFGQYLYCSVLLLVSIVSLPKGICLVFFFFLISKKILLKKA
jgi:hypothetical protein